MLNSKHVQIYIYLCDNTLKFKKNEEVGVIKCSNVPQKSFKIYLKVKKCVNIYVIVQFLKKK